MPVKLLHPRKCGRAEAKFREALKRLQRGKPERLPKGARVTQNNVAKEAGVDPSALKKARFPGLVAEIQRWVEEHAGDAPRSSRQTLLAQRSRARDLRHRIEALELQRDKALSQLVEADARILELSVENLRLQALVAQPDVTALRKSKPGR